MPPEATQQPEADLNAALQQGIPGHTPPVVTPQATPAAPATPAPTSPNTLVDQPPTPANAVPTAPAAGQPDPNQTPDNQTQASPEGQKPAKPAIDIDAVFKHSALSNESDYSETESLKRERAASSKEAKRLVAERKKLDEKLAEQKMAIKLDDAGEVQIVRTGKLPKVENTDPMAYDELNRTDRKAFEKMIASDEDLDPEELFDFVSTRATKVQDRIAPTADHVVERISPERHEIAVNTVSEKNKDLLPTFLTPEGKAVVDRMIEALPRAVKRAYYEEPELMLRFLAADTEVIVNHAGRLAQAQEEARTAKEQATNTVAGMTNPAAGTMTPTIGSPPQRGSAGIVVSSEAELDAALSQV